MQDKELPVNLVSRLEELRAREQSYLEDELYSLEALTNLRYRAALERCFNKDPLAPQQVRPRDKSL